MELADTAISYLSFSHTELMPKEIRDAYSIVNPENIRKIGNGMVNATFYAESGDNRLIIQRLSPIFREEMVEDYQAVSAHLTQEGWKMPQPILTRSDELTAADHDGNIWRAVTYLESDSTHSEPIENITDPQAYGRLLGKLHASLKAFDYTPRFSLPHFHDTAYYADRLANTAPDIPTSKGRRFGAVLLKTLAILPPLPKSDRQLIHGDPRTANILPRKGEPFTFIDWDTLMKGCIWMDIGDMLRSVAEDAVQEDKPIPVDRLTDIAEGYRQVACPDADPHMFEKDALLAAQTMALELAMRFVADYKDGEEGYFVWDELHYSSRHAYTIDRATYQMAIFRQIENYKQEQAYA